MEMTKYARIGVVWLLLCGSSCHDKSNFTLTSGSSHTIDFFDTTLTFEISDTAGYFSKYPVSMSEWKKQKYDTVFRFAPVSYLGHDGILIARLNNGKISRYDLVYDDYSFWKTPFLKLVSPNIKSKHPDTTDQYWKSIINRRQSSVEEFEFLFRRLRAIYGEPDKMLGSTDKEYTWNKYHLSIYSLNNFNTTIISRYSEGDSARTPGDWQLTALSPDISMLKINLGESKTILRERLSFRDSSLVTADFGRTSIGVVDRSFWGIPGVLSLIFDKDGKLRRIVWTGYGTGQPNFLGVFKNIATLLQGNLSTEAKIDASSGDLVKIRWREKGVDDLLIYYNPYEFDYIKCDAAFTDKYLLK